jgi:beta-N-acetylhexosaminidase
MNDLSNIDQAIGQKLLLTFEGKHAPTTALLKSIRRLKPAGFTLFRAANIDNPGQVRQLTQALQQAAREASLPPFLIATDQEGGQLMAIGEGATPFPGNLALGATGSEDLAYQVGFAIGSELAAMGVNVNYAPVCDVNVNPSNPVVGARAFGEDPALVAHLAAAQVRGLQAAGVAATAKHFPGHGDTAQDSHYGVPVVPHDAGRLAQVELPPFEAAIQAGVRLVLTAHLALPAFNGELDLPATLSAKIIQGLLRKQLGFEGVIVSDAMDMKAIRQGDGLPIDAIAAAAAGVDLLLLNHPAEDQERVYTALYQACQRAILAADQLMASAGRVLALKGWLEGQSQPELDVVGCAEHQALALEVARKSMTRVRDTAGLLPLRLRPEARLAAILPQPQDLTPADTSSTVKPELAAALRQFHPNVDEFVVPLEPDDEQIAALRKQAQAYDLIVAGTFNAASFPAQARLVEALVSTEVPVVAAALRMPYDLASFPSVSAYVCAYGILPPSMQALAEALFGKTPWSGRLPVSIPGIVKL